MTGFLAGVLTTLLAVGLAIALMEGWSFRAAQRRGRHAAQPVRSADATTVAAPSGPATSTAASTAAKARPADDVGLALHPELEWEPIYYPGGLHVARRVPVAELTVGDDPGVIVLFTHDYGLAARVGWPLWREEQDGRLTQPVRHWWCREPADLERDGYEHMWWPAQPGTPGVIPLVQFPFPPSPP